MRNIKDCILDSYKLAIFSCSKITEKTEGKQNIKHFLEIKYQLVDLYMEFETENEDNVSMEFSKQFFLSFCMIADPCVS